MIYELKPRRDKFIQDCYKQSMKELNEFFKLKWTHHLPNIYLMSDRKTINELRGQETGEWVVGFAMNNNVYLLSPENFEQESCHAYSKESYAKLIKHELCHLFFTTTSSYETKPKWLFEGTAVYLAGQEVNNRLERIMAYNEKVDDYKTAGLIIKLLVEQHGKNKLLTLIKSLRKVNSEESFNQVFEKTYGFELKRENFQEKEF